MSRLDYAPKLKEIQVTDFQKGLGNFTPQPDKPVSFAALKATLKKAGYTLDAADITVSGKLLNDESGWSLVVGQSGQRFKLTGPNLDQVLSGWKSGVTVDISGDWQTVGMATNVHEVIEPAPRKQTLLRFPGVDRAESPLFINASFNEPLPEPVSVSANKRSAPIRVTSPGLTVYKGGAVTPRFYFVKQHLGSLEVSRQLAELSVSYTPSPRVQLEIEAPFSHTEYDDQRQSGSTTGLGNIIMWGKYRFFRKVKTYGDRQAAFRAGLELPTGSKSAPGQARVNVPAFVRQQLTPINGGLSPHFDLAFSQAGGRFIFGGNAEAIFRTEREGFRMGHEQRFSTDFEYVLPRDPHKPGRELFLILETTFVHRSLGRLNSHEVLGSSSTEYYLAPGLQYAARPQFVIEGSYQFPVVRNTGPLALRTDRNLLLGVRVLF
ncbi:MAG TPA: hypothetical protein VI306_25835 [Pyrinomonadaceae bacterium]